MTLHRQVFAHTYFADWYSRDGDKSDSPPESFYRIFECSTCKDLCIFEGVAVDEENEGVLVYPQDTTLAKSIPEKVASNYREAKRVQKTSPNAFAVLIRRALEALCDDRKVPEGKLYVRLEYLAKNSEIPPVLAEITSVLRELGNSGAHNAEHEVTVPMTWSMDKFFQSLVEYVYVAPASLEEFRRSMKDPARPLFI